MGCAQSRVDNEEAVVRCKERRNVIKEAVSASKAFAAGHFAYAITLKNTGAALSDYGHGESDQALDVLDQSHYQQHNVRTVDPAPQPPPPPPIENLPPPPPPLPKFSPSPIKRAISLPAMAVRGRKLRTIDSLAIEEEGDEEEDNEEEERVKDGGRATTRKEEEEEQSSPRTPENVGNGRKRPDTPEIVSASPANSMAWDYFFMVENMPGPNLDDRDMGNEYDTRNNNHFHFNEEEEVVVVKERSGIFRKNSGLKITEEMEPKTPENVKEVEEEEEENDEDEEEEEGGEEEDEEDAVMEEAKNKKKGKAKIEHSNTAPPDFRRVVAKTTASSVNLMKILDEIDDRFLKASECAQEVSKMLEATRLHYHSNFADNRGIEVVFSSLIRFLS